jgi:hypothetical protein
VPEDFTGLGAFECYLQLMADNAVQSWCSGKTSPPPRAISNPDVVRAVSRRHFGVSQAAVDDSIQKLIGGRVDTIQDDLSPRRRRVGGIK